jgi:transcriptional regulator with XRE-family HTH domain
MRTTKAAQRFVAGVGRNIRAERKARGLGQGALGKKLAIDAPTVSRIESGQRDLRTSELFEIGRALGASPAALVTVETEGQ